MSLRWNLGHVRNIVVVLLVVSIQTGFTHGLLDVSVFVSHTQDYLQRLCAVEIILGV